MNRRELATVLAALRYWQRVGTLDKGAPEDDIATEGGTIQPLDVAEIDDFCEELNL